jgi:hypothetical protein
MDVAAIFHWSPDYLWSLSISDLLRYHQGAVSRFNRMNGVKDK